MSNLPPGCTQNEIDRQLEDWDDISYWVCPVCRAVGVLTDYGDEGDLHCEFCGYQEEPEPKEPTDG